MPKTIDLNSAEVDQKQLFNCLVHITSFPERMSDHLTFSKPMIASNFRILQDYFPGHTPTTDFVPSTSQSSERILDVKFLGPIMPTSSSSVEPKSIKPVRVRIFGEKYQLLPDEELAIPIPADETHIQIKFHRKQIQLPALNLLSQQPFNLIHQSQHFQVQYLYQSEPLDLTNLFPAISAKNYPDLLLKFRIITEKPSKIIRWVLSEFESRYGISPLIRAKHYINLALELQLTFDSYILHELGQQLYYIQDKTAIADECQKLLNKLSSDFLRYDLVYPASSIESYKGCISGVIFLILILAPNGEEILVNCINEHINWNYEAIKLNVPEDCVFSKSRDLSVLAGTTQVIIDTLIHFAKYYEQEFIQYFDMLHFLANGYYNNLKKDIENTEIILTPESIDLYNNLSKLYELLYTCKFISRDQALPMEYIFSRISTDYLKRAELSLREIIPTLIKRDLFQPMNEHVDYSQSLRDLFSFINYYSRFLFNFQFSLTRHKLYLLYILEGTIEDYLFNLLKRGNEFLTLCYGASPSSVAKQTIDLDEHLFVISKIYVIIHNLLNLRVFFQSFINGFKENDPELQYSLDRLELKIQASIHDFIGIIVQGLPPEAILQQNLDDREELIELIYNYILSINNSGLPENILKKMYEAVFVRVIHWFEDQLLSKHHSRAQLEDFIKFIRTELTEPFFENDLVLSQQTIDKHSKLFIELEGSLHMHWDLNTLQNHSVFVIQLLAPKELSYITKSMHKLGYTKDQILLNVSRHHHQNKKGFLFHMNNSLDFIYENRKKVIALEPGSAPTLNGHRPVTFYTKSAGKGNTFFSGSQTAQQEASTSSQGISSLISP